MSVSTPLNIKLLFKQALYLIVFVGYSVCFSGSFEDFFVAITRDDHELVAGLLRRGFDANTSNGQGETGLFLAIRASSAKVAALLVEWPGTTVEERTLKDESPLMLAALKGWTEFCQKLIARGADVNKPGWAPLHYAATNGHLAVMALLLDEHAYIDATSPNGTTPLMMAAHYGTSAAVNLLLEAGADPALRNDLGLSALDFAQQADRTEAAEIIAGTIRRNQPKGSW